MRAALVLLMIVAGGPVSAIAESLTASGSVTILKPSRSRHPDNSNAVVWLVPLDGAGARARRPEGQRLQLLQKHKRFQPHVLVAPVGAVVEFPNLDPFFHNVFSLFDGKRFDLGLYEAGSVHSVHFDRPGVCYIFCNIHPEMSAVVLVLETPYYGVSDRTGLIKIEEVPAGRYFLHAWYEQSSPEVLKAASREVTLAPGEASLGTIRLETSGNLLNGHKNKYGLDYESPTPPGPFYGEP